MSAEKKKKAKRIHPKRGGIQKSEGRKTETSLYESVKRCLSDIGRSFSRGADKVADIFLDDSQKTKSEKGKRLKEETLNTFKEITSGIKESLKNLKSNQLLSDASYEIGRLSRIAKNTCVEIFNDLME
jgi:hypothetical protein